MRKARKPDQETIESLLASLALTTASREIAKLLKESEGASYTEFLRRVLACERDARQERRRNGMIKRSRLGGARGLAELDYSKRKDVKPALLAELGTCRFVEEKRNVVLVGPPGTGKTTLGQALALAAAMEGYSMNATLGREMLDDMRAAESDGSSRRISRRYLRPEILLIDEVWPQEPWQGPLLFRVVAARHKKASIVFVSNVAFERWKDGFTHEPMAVATLDRLLDQATVLRFSGESYRKPREVVDMPTDAHEKRN